MHLKIKERASFPVVAVKVLALVLPSIIASEVFRTHSKVAFGVGLLVGSFLWYLIPPRGKIRQLFILISVCLLIGIGACYFPRGGCPKLRDKYHAPPQCGLPDLLYQLLLV
jgi:hypothetical protein